MQNNKNSILIKTIGITSVILIVIICGLYFWNLYNNCYKAVLKVGNHDISECEYTYYYNSYYKYYMNSFSPLFDYMGVDSSLDLMTQQYDDERSFEQMFKDSTIDQIKEIYSLYDDALADGFEYDSEEVYNGYVETIEKTLVNTDNTLLDYYKTYFGENISEKLAKKYLCMGYYSLAYYNKLVDDLGEEEAYKYKQELKNKMEVICY